MKKILTALFSLITVSTFAQKEIKAEDSKNHVDETVKICAKIYGGRFF